MSARILVVDDIPANVKLLEARLSAEYFDVVTASNGAVSGTGTTSVTVTPASLTVAIDPVTATAGVAATITAHVSSVGAITNSDRNSDSPIST